MKPDGQTAMERMLYQPIIPARLAGVRLADLLQGWRRFFFEPILPTSIGLFRIIFGLLLLVDGWLLHPNWLVWYGQHGILPLDAARALNPNLQFSLMFWLPTTDGWVMAIYFVLIGLALLVTLGLFTRFSTAAMFLMQVSIQHRNIWIMNSGDTILRVVCFLLIFSAAGKAYSIDRWWRVRTGRESAELKPCSPWAQRLIQIQMCIIYISTFYWKMLGRWWVQGYAMYFVMFLDDFRRFPVPKLFLTVGFLKLLTWGTLLIEWLLGFGVWIKRWRYPILGLGILFHMSIEYSMNIPLFEWIMISLYITFVDPADLQTFFSRWRKH
jgi:hypothetical protein